MRVLGIDPGYATVGYGSVEYLDLKFRPVCYGTVNTKANIPLNRRLMSIDGALREILDNYNPDAVAVEKLFFTSNQKTAIDVAQARGVILLCVTKSGIPVYEYTPLQVKQSVTGYGKADKRQVMEMTRLLLSLKEIPKPDDAADALAIAICHAHSAGSLLGKIKNQGEVKTK